MDAVTNYKKFALMMTLSFFMMYAVMFLNVDRVDHIYFSVTRMYMTLLMVSPMAILKLFIMKKMYPDKRLNATILFISAMVFFGALFGLRGQAFIGERQYMRAMIPHHSSAILTSENAQLNDPEVLRLSKEIIETQKQEIELMKRLLAK